MRRWIVIAAALVCPACATSESPPDPREPEVSTAPPPEAPGDGADPCEAPRAAAQGECGGDEAPPDDDEGDRCRKACVEAVDKGCDWVVAMCDAADAVKIGTAKIPCLLATLVACGAATPIICEVLCPR